MAQRSGPPSMLSLVSSRSVTHAIPIKARRHPLVSQVRRNLRLRCGYDETLPLLIGVRGGSDSLALLIASKVICGGVLIAAHVHHHLRVEADADVAHLQDVCQQLGVPLVIEHVHPGDEIGNLAAAARRLRYDALCSAASAYGCRFVAVGHHAEDQLETMLMALCRGTGLDGLSAMGYHGSLKENVSLIRPLLDAAKASCQSLCEAAGLQWREDASNVDRAKARARLRADVLPVLEELWPGAALRSAATADLLGAARELVSDKLDEFFADPTQRRWKRDRLRQIPTPLLASGIRRVVIGMIGHPSDDIGQRQLLPIAQAITDDERRPRDYRLADTVITVTAHEVTIANQ